MFSDVSDVFMGVLLGQMYGLIWLTDLRNKLSRMDLVIMLPSALCHDLDHPGYNNVYQVASTLFGLFNLFVL